MIDTNTTSKKSPPVASDYLDGESPRERGAKKQRRVLEWLFRWGYSSADLINRVSGQMKGGYAKGLVKKGLLIETETESGFPKNIYTLSESGLEEASVFSKELYPYKEIDPYKVNQFQIKHYLLAQKVTLDSIDNGIANDYETERMYSQEGDKSGIKRPDVVWILKNGDKYAVEVELSAKWDRRLDEFVLGIYKALRSTNDAPAKYSRFAIATRSQNIIDRYKEALSPGANLKIWHKNSRQHWEVKEVEKVPDWLIKSIDFFMTNTNK